MIIPQSVLFLNSCITNLSAFSKNNFVAALESGLEESIALVFQAFEKISNIEFGKNVTSWGALSVTVDT